MVTPAAGEVVLVPFPFSDLSQSKVRPAVCLADAGQGDWILCQITSNPYGDPQAESLDAPDFETGGLLVPTFSRPGRLFTATSSLLVRSVGKLNAAPLQVIQAAFVALCRSNPGPPGGPTTNPADEAG